MEKQQLLEKAQEHLTPFETSNLIDFIQHFDTQTAAEHPLIALLFLILAFYAFVKRKKVILLLLFATISIMVLVRFTLSPETVEKGITLSSMLPFAAGGLIIGGALIYLMFISND